MDDSTITFAVLGAAVALFVWDGLPVAIVAIAVALSLWATGVLGLDDALAGFAAPGAAPDAGHAGAAGVQPVDVHLTRAGLVGELVALAVLVVELHERVHRAVQAASRLLGRRRARGVSEHLTVLRRAGLVLGRREGRRVIYARIIKATACASDTFPLKMPFATIFGNFAKLLAWV